MPTALITGITGQDGSYLAELLLEKGYTVYGMARRETWFRQNNASHLRERIHILLGDMTEGVDISSAVQDAQPDEIYNLASQSRPGESPTALAIQHCQHRTIRTASTAPISDNAARRSR